MARQSPPTIEELRESFRVVLHEVLHSPLSDDERLELEGRRRSMEVMLHRADADGMIPVAKTEITEQGVRIIALKAAGQFYAERIGYGLDGAAIEDVLESARKVETFLRGGFVASELPKITETIVAGPFNTSEELDSGQQDDAQRRHELDDASFHSRSDV